MKKTIKTVISFLLNPRLLFCFGVAWIVTNGWSYIMMGLGTYYGIDWMVAVSGAYLAFLWLPFTPEKVVTLAVAVALLRLLFPQDEKTLAILRKGLEKAKAAMKSKKEKKTTDQTKDG